MIIDNPWSYPFSASGEWVWTVAFFYLALAYVSWESDRAHSLFPPSRWPVLRALLWGPRFVHGMTLVLLALLVHPFRKHGGRGVRGQRGAP